MDCNGNLLPDECELESNDCNDDGVPDDGDGSGTAGDAPCTNLSTEGCDDNCPLTANSGQQDLDADLRGDACDCDFNCAGNVDAGDVTSFLIDFGRNQFNDPCPACVEGAYCLY